MVAYSFQLRFVEPILLGIKHQTIRGDRKRHARPGDQLQLFTGMRTRQCRRIGTATCASVRPIILDFSGRSATIDRLLIPYANCKPELEHLARSDGFSCWAEMASFWHPQERFEGWLISWRKFVADGDWS